jgi:transcriptional regulator with XRE-family HTH domain
MTQVRLAALVGTEGSVISLLESGDRSLSDKWLRRLAPALDTTPGLLLDHDPENVDPAMMEIFVHVPEARQAGVVASLSKHVSTMKRRSEAPQPSQGKVVKLQKSQREGDEDPLSDSKKSK